MKLLTTWLILAVAIAAIGFATSSLLAEPPAPVDPPPSREAAASASISALTCPSCNAENQLLPINYGRLLPRPKSSIVDGEECEPPQYHAGGCSIRQEKWYCRKCGVKYGMLSKQIRQTAARLLAGQLTNGNTCDRRKAIYLLSRVDPGITDAFPTVAAALDDPDFKVRASAIVALMRSYRHGRNTQINRLAPKITVLLADPESDVRRAALFAVGTLKIEPETSISAIVASLRDSDAAIRSSAATELSRARFNWAMTETVEKKLADAIPAVASLLDDEALYVRSSAFRAILSMGETFTLPLPVTQQMYVALEKAIVAARVSALHASKKAISNGIASTHKDTLLNTVSSPVDAMFSLSSHAEIPAAVARAIYSMFERELENGNENKRFFAVRSIMRVSAKLKVPSSTIERLGGLFDNPSAAVRDIASKALLEVRHGDE